MDINPLTLGDPADPTLPACQGCGARHKHRTTIEHLCPCCMHPHDGHRPKVTWPGDQRKKGCTVRHCKCVWPDAAPIVRDAGQRVMRPLTPESRIIVRGASGRSQ